MRARDVANYGYDQTYCQRSSTITIIVPCLQQPSTIITVELQWMIFEHNFIILFQYTHITILRFLILLQSYTGDIIGRAIIYTRKYREIVRIHYFSRGSHF